MSQPKFRTILTSAEISAAIATKCETIAALIRIRHFHEGSGATMREVIRVQIGLLRQLGRAQYRANLTGKVVNITHFYTGRNV